MLGYLNILMDTAFGLLGELKPKLIKVFKTC